MRYFTVVLLVALVLLVVESNVFGAEKHWRSTSNANWSVSGNWDLTQGGLGGAGAPTTSDTAYIDGGTVNCNINSNSSCKKFVHSLTSRTTTFNSGVTLTVGTGGVVITGGTLDQTGGGNISDAGNWTQSGGTYTSGSTTVVLNGSSTQTFSASSSFSGLTISNSSGGVTLSSNITVSGTLTLTSGTVTTGANKISVTNTATGAVAITSGNVNGEVVRTLPSTSTSGQYTFTDSVTSITLSSFNPAGITVSVKSFPNTQPPNTTGNDVAVHRYYTITPSGALTGTLKLRYLNSELNGNTASNLSVWRLNGTPAWVDESGFSTTGGSQGFVTSFNPISTWSNWTMAVTGAALPIQLSAFSSSVVDENNVQLSWSTLTEVNNYGFFVQRRGQSDLNFSDLPNSFVAGHGTTTEGQNYTWTDMNVPSGTYDYRLHQLDLDGSEGYSPTVSITVKTPLSVGNGDAVPAVFKLNQNYPNPFNPSTKIAFSLADANFTTLKVYNILGQEVATLFSGMADAGQMYVVNFDASNIGNGVYFYRLESGSKVDIRKMTLLK